MKKYTKLKNNLSQKKQALEVFEYTVKSVPAYRKFLKEYKINPKKIIDNKDFESIPVMEKDNYLRVFNPLKLVPRGKFPPMISASSGSSGKPYYWPRGDEHEILGGKLHEKIINDIFKLKKTKTLAIICFSMGNWIAGTFTLASLREVARNNKQTEITTITPGIDKDDTIAVLKNLAPIFESVILIGYPPFLMDIIIGAKENGVNLKKIDLHFILAGENFSEKWRSMLLKISGITDKKDRAISIYGTADAGALGHENPLTITLRKLAENNKNFKKDLLGDVTFIPTIVEYSPNNLFFETINNELIFTTKAGIPLIRYNIKDHGLLLENKYIIYLLKKHKMYNSLPKSLLKWKNPVIILKGRNDVSVTFYALNIYPENIKAGLEDDSVIPFITGKYVARTEQSKNFRKQTLYIDVELKSNIYPTNEIKKGILNSVVKNLLKLNTEYRKLYNSIHNDALPIINLIPHGHKQFITKKAKHKWFKKE